MLISPSIGRVVWFHPDRSRVGSRPLAAIVTDVFGDRCINVAVFEKNGVPMSHPPTSVTLLQEGDKVPLHDDGTHVRHCTWMPCQVGQAKKHANDPPTSTS